MGSNPIDATTFFMKLQIIGDGAFGTFLKELLNPHFNICNQAESIILAVPLSAYEEVATKNKGKHLINVCSVQKPSTDICLKHSDRVTSIHPLFGRRTPADKRNSILTFEGTDNDTWSCGRENECEFLLRFGNVSQIFRYFPFGHSEDGKPINPDKHDLMMSKTHMAALMGAQQMKVYIDRAKDIPDHLIPHSFRLMKEFVKTLDDMPAGTVESILGNPYN